MTDESFDLLPCPFCGSSAELYERDPDSSDLNNWDVACTNRNCFLGTGADFYSEKSAIAQLWNTRVSGMNYDAAGYPAKDEHEKSQMEVREVTWILEMPQSVWMEVLRRLQACAFPKVQYMPGDDAIMARSAVNEANRNAYEILDLFAEFAKRNGDFSEMAKRMQTPQP